MTLNPGVRFDPTITFGNVLTLIALLGTLFGAWASVRSDLRSQEERLAYIEQRTAVFEQGAVQREGRLRSLEIGASASDARYAAILAELQRITAWIERQNEARTPRPTP